MPSKNLPVISFLLAAAVLTALGAIGHTQIIWNLIPAEDDYDGPLYIRVGSGSDHTLSFLRNIPTFNRSKYTFDKFVVAGGIDLAQFGLGNHGTHLRTRQEQQSSQSFQLFQDFDLSHRIIGNETWIELLEYRRDATHPSLSFYVDKVAFKRWLEASYSKLGIDGIKPYVLKYASELYREAEAVQSSKYPTLSTESVLTRELFHSLPTDDDYVAKPTHLSCSGGVWLIHKDQESNTTYVGNGKKKMKAWSESDKMHDVRTDIAEDLSANLQKVQEKCGRTVVESYALRHVRPGIVVEERFTQPAINEEEEESFLKGGMEFKVFTIWGRAWLTVWRPGTDGVKALFFRNGTNLVFDPPIKKNHKTTKSTPAPANPSIPPTLPDWLEWDKVISIAETLGRHKDMFRTDIFVGVSSSSEGNEIRYVVSETEIHPTPLRGFETIFEEAGRLWLAGYFYLFSEGAIRVFPNTEVPASFFDD